MRAIDKKKLMLCLCAALAAASLLLCVILLLWRCLSTDHDLIYKKSDVVILSGEEKIFEKDILISSLSEKDTELIFSAKKGKERELFLLFSADGTLDGESFCAYSPLRIILPSSGEATFSLALSAPSQIGFFEREKSGYAFDEKSFAAVKDYCSQIVFIAPSRLSSLTLSRPQRIFGDFGFEEIIIRTQEEGTVVIASDRENCASLQIDAPNAAVRIDKTSFTFEDALTDFYVKARSLNKRELSPLSFPVAEFAQLRSLAEGTAFHSLPSGAEILFVKEFSLEENLVFTMPVSFSFPSALDFGGSTLGIETEEAGAIKICGSAAFSPVPSNFSFFAPLLSLQWEGGTIPLMTTVERELNLASFNGSPLALGGEGKAEPVLSLPASENSFLTHSLDFTLRGNTLYATLPALVTKEDLSAASPCLSCENGTAVFDKASRNADGTVNLTSPVIAVTDQNGKIRSYTVVFQREGKELPILTIETDGGAEITSKSQYVSATLSLSSSDAAECIEPVHIRIRGRGNSTWKWDKKPYKIHFDTPTSVLGLYPSEEWALLANYSDKSLMRNSLALAMASTLSFDYVPSQKPVDVYLNGDYIGVYSIGEHLESGEGRVKIASNPNSQDCGFFLEAGGTVTGVDVQGKNYFHAGLVKFVLIKTPETKILTDAQFDYIKHYMKETNDAIVNGENWQDYLDAESFIDWLIMIELTNNTDCAFRRSTFFIKNPGEKLKMGPVWDFDLAFGNFSKDNDGYSTWCSTEPDDDYIGTTWSTYLLKDPEFQKLFRSRWEEVEEALFDTAMAEIDRNYDLIAPSAADNFQLWRILGRKVAFERHDTVDYPTYYSQIQYLKDFLLKRAAWIDLQVADW